MAASEWRILYEDGDGVPEWAAIQSDLRWEDCQPTVAKFGAPVSAERLARIVPSPLPRFLTTEEVANLLRTSPETVRYWRHVGKGPKSFKVGRRVLYAAEDVESFIAAAQEAQ